MYKFINKTEPVIGSLVSLEDKCFIYYYGEWVELALPKEQINYES